MKRFLSLMICSLLVLSAAAQTRIAVLADLHVSPGNRNSQKLKEVVAEINADPTQIVIVAGDLTNEGSDEELTCVKEILDGLKKPQFVPCIFLPANQLFCKTSGFLWVCCAFQKAEGRCGLLWICPKSRTCSKLQKMRK